MVDQYHHGWSCCFTWSFLLWRNLGPQVLCRHKSLASRFFSRNHFRAHVTCWIFDCLAMCFDSFFVDCSHHPCQSAISLPFFCCVGSSFCRRWGHSQHWKSWIQKALTQNKETKSISTNLLKHTIVCRFDCLGEGMNSIMICRWG